MSGDATVAATVVVVSHNEGDLLHQTVEALVRTTPREVEIVVVDDHSTDGSAAPLAGRYPFVGMVRPPRRLGVAGARNFGARAARGRVLVFSDAHVAPAPDWLEPLCRAVTEDGAVAAAPAISPMVGGSPGYGFTWRDATLTSSWLRRRPDGTGDAPMLCGCFVAVRRDVFEEIGGFDTGLTIWGLEDAELSLRLWRMGRRCVVVPQVLVRHLFRPRFPYRVDWSVTLHNILRLGVVHFGERALTRVLERFADNPALPATFARLVEGDAWLRRAAVGSRCPHDDEWFFRRFAIDALR